MAITDWPKEERPREKLLERGAAALLEIFLRTGVPGKTAVDLARELLSRFGSLRALITADMKQFCEGQGLGEAKFTQLQATVEMARRHFSETLQRCDVLENPEQTQHFLSARLRDYSFEVFSCLYLDNRHRVIQIEELF